MVDNVGTRWFFDSGSLALDLGYTGDYDYGRPEWERWHEPADMTDWLTQRFGDLDAPASEADYATARRLRAAISRIARAVADGETPDPQDVDLVNDTAAEPDLAPVLDGGSRPPTPVTVRRALSTVARDAVHTFGHGAERVRRCNGTNCELIFFDSSRPNVRRWCSMRRCGNRAKVRTHRSQLNQAQAHRQSEE